MNKWPDEALERRMLSNAGPAFVWVNSLIERVRALEKHEAALTESLVEVLAGWRCLAAQFGGLTTYDAAILDKAHTALEGGRNELAGSP